MSIADLCTCKHSRGEHYDERGSCTHYEVDPNGGERCSCTIFAKDGSIDAVQVSHAYQETVPRDTVTKIKDGASIIDSRVPFKSELIFSVDREDPVGVHIQLGEEHFSFNFGDESEGTFVGLAIQELERILQSKGHDYAHSGEFENFEAQARASETTMPQVFRGMLGQKLNRESTLRKRAAENDDHIFESRLDTIRDIAGYAVLWYAWELSQK